MIKRFVIALVLLVIVVGGIVGFNIFRDRAIADFFANRPVPDLPVDTIVAEAGDWQPTLEAIGTVYSVQGVELAVETAGVVREVSFEANEWVEEGEVLLRIGDEMERAELAAAESSVELAEQTLARVSSLGDRGIAAASSVDEAEAALSSAQAQIQRIGALIEQKTLVAPFSGEIGIPAIEVGEFVTAGTTVATLQNVETLRVDFTVSEQDLPQLEIGRPVEVSTDAGETASGHITGIEPRVDPATRLVGVRAELDNENGALRPGQFVQVNVALPIKQNIVSVPQTAVVTSLYGDYVFAVVPSEDSTDEEPRLVASQVFVETGSREGSWVEISDGVDPGDRVVIAGQNRLTNGAPVMLSETESPAEDAVPMQENPSAAVNESGSGAAAAAEPRE